MTYSSNDLEPVAAICLDAFLAARYCTRDVVLSGRAWEGAVLEMICRPGLEQRQAAGLTTLFGTSSFSRTNHELDAVSSGWRGCILTECKARKDGLGKADVAVFDLKTFDFYCAQLDEAASSRWWRILVSATPVSNRVRALCAQWEVVLCDTARMPLPVLLRFAADPRADQYVPEVKLSELVRLAEPACRPLQARWRPLPTGDLLFRPKGWSETDVDDLLWLQDELSDDLLDLYDTIAPGRLERRIAALSTLLQGHIMEAA